MRFTAKNMRTLVAACVLLPVATWAHQGHDSDSVGTEKSPAEPAMKEVLSKPGNEFCPVLPDEPVDPELYANIDGEQVYVCCKKCLRQLKENPSKYLSKQVVEQADAAQTNSEQTGSFAPWERLLELVARSHVVIIHFPIALIILAAASSLARLIFSWDGWKPVIEVTAVGGSLAAVVAAVLGWMLAWQVSYQGEDAVLLEWHRWFGVATAVCGIGVLWCWWAYRKERVSFRVFTGSVVLTAVLVGATGHFGGSLIYGADYFKW